jgi:hypothetical protein
MFDADREEAGPGGAAFVAGDELGAGRLEWTWKEGGLVTGVVT